MKIEMRQTKCDACALPNVVLCVVIDERVMLCEECWKQTTEAVFQAERAVDRGFRQGVEQDLSGQNH